MTQVTLTDKGIGPFQYNGFNYYVAPTSDRVLCSWIGKEFFDKRKPKKGIRLVPSKEELNEVIYKNKDKIDAADITIGGSTSPSLTSIGACAAKDGDNTRSTTWAWTSTEYSSASAWAQGFFDGLVHVDFKNAEFWIICLYKEPIV